MVLNPNEISKIIFFHIFRIAYPPEGHCQSEIDGSRPCHWSRPERSAGQFVTAFEFFRLARYDCLHRIPHLKQMMLTSLSSDTNACKDTDWVEPACAPYYSFVSFFPRRRSTGPGRVVDDVERSSVRLTPRLLESRELALSRTASKTQSVAAGTRFSLSGLMKGLARLGWG